MSGTYGFYAACLRFVARRTDAVTPEIAAMMRDLEEIAVGVEAEGAIVVAPARLSGAARALAGVAGMLQQHILPEAVAAGDAAAEARVRWMIDASMEAVAALSAQAQLAAADDAVRLALPPLAAGS
ncbi:MAG: hypothetical protein AB7D00_14590 [Rhodospirillaceae bacterium]